jgi:hypothetical protein
MTEKQKVFTELEPMFKEAREKGLWFYCSFEDLWFSPDELKSEQKNGNFIWGVCNWELRNPKEHVACLENRIRSAERELLDFQSRLG